MQDTWMIRKAKEIQGYVDRNEMKNFLKAIKAIYGPCINGTAPLFSSEGTTLLTEKSQIRKRWAEHFRSVLNFSSAISDAALDRLPQADKNNDLDLPPSLPETIRAVQQISSGKAPGSEAITQEFLKHGGPRLMAELTTLFQEVWSQGQVPQDFKNVTIVHHYKRKSNRQLCDNHRGISLLNIARKIFARETQKTPVLGKVVSKDWTDSSSLPKLCEKAAGGLRYVFDGGSHSLIFMATTIIAVDGDVEEDQLVVFFLFHRQFYVREDVVETFYEREHLIPFDDDEGFSTCGTHT
ncbi:unnamed protein product [Schistocephalus solidus]|uniref:Uncharacterized protein n=1 Tax=Schistocephalus solidus TaxID=70667 RepID=A0A183T8T9_SCHSO|nr:unnamed protein product [Schistocephalus solidus]